MLGACTSFLTPKLDEITGTTKAARCVDYQTFLASAVALQAVSPTDARKERIVLYRLGVEANCPVAAPTATP